ncbi:hypothetical protein [Microbacterium azadirachtae]|uniref:hypothetical protein n=1 Tax=Microbacterium azadirachtae TaxID=582680 RepID=UPI0015876128|nr:hypothetical protein [Microbacterium azadirachtae]
MTIAGELVSVCLIAPGCMALTVFVATVATIFASDAKTRRRSQALAILMRAFRLPEPRK